MAAVLIAASTLASGAGTSGVRRLPEPAPDEARIVAAFKARVAQYVEMHRRLEGLVPTVEVSPDPVVVQKAIAALGGKIRAERRRAKPGDVITPTLAPILRRLIAEGCNRDFEGLLATVVEENGHAGRPLPRINDPYPAGAAYSMIPPGVLCNLPELPDELQYRFIGRTLILPTGTPT
jgi:hypothetical protein